MKKLLHLDRLMGGQLDIEDAPAVLAAHLRVRPGTPLIALLHGDDRVLRKFWQYDRRRLLSNLRRMGFVAATGPTFSIVSNPAQRSSAENHYARRQHHQVIQEIHDAGLMPIPNLYAAGALDLRRTAEWLRSETLITTVSRDLSRTKSENRVFDAELTELADILAGAGRALHLVAVGVGVMKAERVVRELGTLTTSISFASAEPIVLALRKGSSLVSPGVREIEIRDSTRDKHELAFENLEAANRHFTRLSLSSRASTRARSRNLLDASAMGA